MSASGGSGAFPPVPLALMLVLVNEFASSTTEFLNQFVADCDVRISSISRRIDRLEMEVLVLEEKFECEEDLPEAAASVSSEKEDTVLTKYLDMLRVGIPRPAVLLKMQANGHFDQYHAQLGHSRD
ncbi:hypothetical protein BASA81_000325 [Batrachochytrium salamandrivorans]|nr:hypothetical protein BASA81_000325 [Batrachochytrium salamandrivorans]